MNTKPIPAVLYAAKSTQDRHRSIPTQLDDGREKSEGEGWIVVGEFTDEGFSAYSGNRGPGLEQAKRKAAEVAEETGTVCMLVAQASDRFARGAGDKPGAAESLAEMWHALRRQNVHLRSVEDDGDLRDSASVANIGHRAMMDSRRKAGAVKKGMARARKEGRYVGGKAYGIDRRRDADDALEPYFRPEAMPVVRRIYAEYLSGITQLKISQKLAADGIPTARKAEWHQGTVGNILSAPVYVGLVFDGEKLIEGNIEGIIDRDTWEQVQVLRKAKARTSGRGREVAGLHLFRKGFLKCGGCGASMVPRSADNRASSPYEIYFCYGQRKRPSSCSMPKITRAEVDNAVLSYFEDVGLDLEATRAQLVAARERKRDEARALLEAAEGQAQAVAEQLTRVRRDYMNGDLTAAEWRELRSELEPEAKAAGAEAERLRAQLAAAEQSAGLAVAEAEVLTGLAQIRAAVAGEIDDADGIAAVRAVLMRMFDHFTLYREDCTPSPAGGARGPEATDVYIEDDRDGERWIEPTMSEHAIEGFDEELRPVLRPKPLVQAGNNYAKGFVM